VPVAGKGDSQEICFVPNGDYAAFIEAYFREQGTPRPAVHGEIVTAGGRTLGEHAGVHHYTVGQRRGLNVAAGEPLYVIATDPASQRVVVGRNEDLLKAALVATSVNWFPYERLGEPARAQVRIRNKHIPAPATLFPTSDPTRVEVRFAEPQRAVTPGPAAVFYDGDLVLGGGWIS
jgi:tRNA-specific 2-thiouridylase